MDLEQKIAHLRQRIQDLRNQVELNNTNTNLEPTSRVEELDPEPVQKPKLSAADAYKARLMKKKSS